MTASVKRHEQNSTGYPTRGNSRKSDLFEFTETDENPCECWLYPFRDVLSAKMVSHPQIECPYCRDVLAPDRQLETHSVGNHTKRELVEYIASEYKVDNIEASPE